MSDPEVTGGDSPSTNGNSTNSSSNGTTNNNNDSTSKMNGSKSGSSETRTPDYAKLIQYGLDNKVASRIDDIYQTG